MDKKSIIGIILIFGILVVFSVMNQPSKEEIEFAKHRKDSIALVNAQKAIEQEKLQKQQALQNVGNEDNISVSDSDLIEKTLQNKIDEFGVFGNAAMAKKSFIPSRIT